MRQTVYMEPEQWMKQIGTGALDKADCMEPEHWMKQTGTEALDQED